jgi:hypothetical protein
MAWAVWPKNSDLPPRALHKPAPSGPALCSFVSFVVRASPMANLSREACTFLRFVVKIIFPEFYVCHHS